MIQEGILESFSREGWGDGAGMGGFEIGFRKRADLTTPRVRVTTEILK
jgi:hypothetical protein